MPTVILVALALTLTFASSICDQANVRLLESFGGILVILKLWLSFSILSTYHVEVSKLFKTLSLH